MIEDFGRMEFIDKGIEGAEVERLTHLYITVRLNHHISLTAYLLGYNTNTLVGRKEML
jgi:hypothetical protein